MGRPRLYPEPVPGDTYDSWTVLSRCGRYKWLCRCICGTEAEVIEQHLTRGNSTQCKGCSVKADRPGARCPDHWRRMYKKVAHAIGRCTNSSNPGFRYYGGRGIKVCEEWLANPEAFIKYLLTLPGHDDESLVLDRENNDGNYEPGNLQFVTHRESVRNRRCSRECRRVLG